MKPVILVAHRLAALALPLAVVACAADTPEPTRSDTRRSPFEVGQLFPDLMLPALEGGEPASIRDYRGQKIVLHVFASW